MLEVQACRSKFKTKENTYKAGSYITITLAHGRAETGRSLDLTTVSFTPSSPRDHCLSLSHVSKEKCRVMEQYS